VLPRASAAIRRGCPGAYRSRASGTSSSAATKRSACAAESGARLTRIVDSVPPTPIGDVATMM
jgi:hypothetical protein